jgi:hypothetical protein
MKNIDIDKKKIGIISACILVVVLATAAVCYFMDINPFSDSTESTTITTTTTTVVIDYTDPNRIAEPLPDGIEEPNWVDAPAPPAL